MEYRVGLGYDIHRLVKGRKLYLGGWEIPSKKGLAGHSDGDCLIHAVIDALLGACSEGNIGQVFPDTDPCLKGIRSTELLKRTMARLKKKKIKVVNVDVVVVAEKPELTPYVPEMKKTLCPLLGIREDRLGIKPKTNEGLGAVGKGKAVASWATVLLAVGKRKGS